MSVLNLLICAGAEDYICHVDRDLLEFAESHYATSPELVCVEFQTFAKQVMQSYQLQEPSTWKDAPHLFMMLTEEYTLTSTFTSHDSIFHSDLHIYGDITSPCTAALF